MIVPALHGGVPRDCAGTDRERERERALEDTLLW